MVEPTHQLAAIMFTDIVGYTRIMGRNEDHALRLLAQNRKIHQRFIEQFNGKLLKKMGDGNLVQFNSALDAVQCASHIQQTAANELDGQLRIGIHLAEVVVQSNDVFGDGVNIAARIQAITEPGGVFISETVQKAIRNRTDIPMEYLAEIHLKNVDYPIKIYALQGGNLPIVTKETVDTLDSLSGKAKASTTRRLSVLAALVVIIITSIIVWYSFSKPQAYRLAILPTDNFVAISDGEYITAGIHSEMIDELSKLGGLIVTSRTSSAKFGGNDKSIPEIATELKVDLVLESELLEISDSFRIKVRLIEAYPEERQVWRKSYNRSSKEIIAVYKDIALEISEATGIDISQEELNQLELEKEIDPEAYKAYLTGMGHLYNFTPGSINKALQYFDLSLSKDSEYAPAYLGIALAWGVRKQFGYISTDEAKPYILNATKKALELDNTSAATHYYLALNSTWFFWNFEHADQEFVRAIKLAPQHAEAYAYYAHYLNIVHRNEEAKVQIKKALKIEPYSPTIRTLYGMHLNHSRNYGEAIDVLLKTLEEDPDYGMALAALWTAYHSNDELDKAFETAKILYSVKGEDQVVDLLINTYYDHNYAYAMEQIAEAFIIKRDTSYVTPWQIATLFVRANNTEKALYWLNKAYKEKDGNMPYINADPIFDKLRPTEGFQSILEKMDLSDL